MISALKNKEIKIVSNNEINSLINEYGYVILYSEDSLEYGFSNAITRGLKENYNINELQLVLPIGSENAGNIINKVASKLIDGLEIYDGYRMDGILKDEYIQLIKIKRKNKVFFRIIFPDNNGKFPDEEFCDEAYSLQYLA